MRIPHRLLQCAEPVAGCQPLDRRHLAAGGLDRQHQARAHRPAVDDDRARTADPVLAAKVGAGEIEVVAQEVRQCLARLRRARARRTVDRQGDIHHQSLPLIGVVRGRLQAAAHQGGRDLPPVVRRPVQVGWWVEVVGRTPRRLVEQLGRRPLAGQEILGAGRPDRYV